MTEIVEGWRPHVSNIENLQTKISIPVLFTEMGYKSTEDTAIEPWRWGGSFSNLYKKVSTETQANCYEAFFKTVWDKEWFAGVHIWQWRSNHERSGGKNHRGFTPQRKPSENVIARGFYNRNNLCVTGNLDD